MILATEKQLAKILDITDRRVRELFAAEKHAGKYPLIKCVQIYIRQMKDGDIYSVNQKTLAEVLGISTKTVQSYTKRGIFRKDPNGNYNIQECLATYLSENDEYNKKKRAETEMTEFRLGILKKTYHHEDHIKFIMTDMLLKFKSRLLGTAVKIDDQIAEISEKERLDYLKNILIETLDELASYEPPEEVDDV